MVKQVLGLLATLLAVASLLPYIVDVVAGRTKPHLFSWVVWTTMTAIAFAAQVVGGGGPGAWATGCTGALCVVIVGLSTVKGEKRITALDWWSLVGCAIAGATWLLTDDPTLSVVLVTLIDVVAFVPTFRKSWTKPHEETVSTHLLSTVKHFLTVAALRRVSVATAFFPAVVGVASAALVAFLLIRRRQVLAPAT